MDKKILFLLLILSIWITGCGKEKPHALPVSEEKMVQVLADVHLAEAALQSLYGNEKDSTAQVYYQQIYLIHNIDEEQFEKTMQLIRRQPETAEHIYGQVMEELSKREAEAEGGSVE